MNFFGLRILVVLCGFYGNARHKPCESNEADRYRVMAAPPLVHRKGHASSRAQQRHQDDHGFGRCRFTCAVRMAYGGRRHRNRKEQPECGSHRSSPTAIAVSGHR